MPRYWNAAAFHDPEDDVVNPVIIGDEPLADVLDRAIVGRLPSPAPGRRSACSRPGTARTSCAAVDASRRFSSRTSANLRPPISSPDGSIGNPPSLVLHRPDRVVVLQGEAQRVHLLMARGAFRLGPVQLHALAQGGGIGGLPALVQLGDAGRRRRGRRAEELLQDPLPSLHRGGPVRVRGQRQDARLRQHAPSPPIRQGDPPELVPLDALEPVMPRQRRR